MSEESRIICSVTELVQTARALLEAKFSNILVQGEIGRFTKHPSGHIYFDLKDEKSLIPCAYFKSYNHALTFKPESGLKVVVGGHLSLFEARGQFQLLVHVMEPQGLGGLQLAFEQLKKKLQEEGLFDEARKKPIPTFPTRIALITSPSGAAIQDFMKILETRAGIEEVELFPVKVQGVEAPEEIRAAILKVSKRQEHDVLVVTRGGGSLEDLASFNDESVVRALADCSVPTISAVGHEVDFTLCDFVADRREPTPTAAAAHIAPGRDEIRESLSESQRRLKEAQEATLEEKRRDLRELMTNLKDRRPDKLLDQARQNLDYKAQELQDALRQRVQDNRLRYQRLADFLARTTPLQQLKPLQERLKGLEAQLQAYHPHGPLKRGYAIVRDKKSGEILRDAAKTRAGERLLIELQKGNVESEVVGERRKKKPESSQEKLF
jgi:exodeoxyribonuclease VII large subunit